MILVGLLMILIELFDDRGYFLSRFLIVVGFFVNSNFLKMMAHLKFFLVKVNLKREKRARRNGPPLLLVRY